MGEDLDKGEAGSAGKGGVNVADTEEDRDKHGESQRAVDADTSKEGVGNDGRGVFDLLAHVDGAIGAQEGKDGCNKANKEGGAWVITAEGEVGSEDVFRGAMRGEVSKGNENAEEPEDMQDKDCAFDLRELGGEVGIKDEGEESDGEK